MKSTLCLSWLTLIISLLIAGCAAYFSVSGLATLFSAELWPVIIMASVLEAGKLGATFWLHHFWKEVGLRLKYALTTAVVILMLITSMGIFGFLSKGHLEQESPVAELSIDIQNAETRVSQHQSRIDSLQTRLNLYNKSLQTLIDYDKISGPEGYLARQKELQPEIDTLTAQIEKEQEKIDTIRDQKSIAKKQMNTIEAKLGPVKYVAQLFGFDLENDTDAKGKAVRIVIVMLMLAFDPLAILLIMASDWGFLKYRQEKSTLKRSVEEENEILRSQLEQHLADDERVDTEIKKSMDEIELIYKDILNKKDKEISTLNEMLNTQENVERVVFRDVDNNELIEELEIQISNLEEEVQEKKMKIEEYEQIMAELEQYLNDKAENTDELDKMCKTLDKKELDIMTLHDDLNRAKTEADKQLKELNEEITRLQLEIGRRDKAVENLNQKYQLVEKLKPVADTKQISHTEFGTSFPSNPSEGDYFLRVDSMPSKLYKYTGTRWMSVNKEEVEITNYDEEYINHLINQIGEGEVSLEELSNSEQKEIKKLLSKEDVLGK